MIVHAKSRRTLSTISVAPQGNYYPFAFLQRLLDIFDRDFDPRWNGMNSPVVERSDVIARNTQIDRSISTSAMSSACASAPRTSSAAFSRSTTSPLRTPWTGLSETDDRQFPESETSPTATQIFEVPISSPTRTWSGITWRRWGLRLGRESRVGFRTGVELVAGESSTQRNGIVGDAQIERGGS